MTDRARIQKLERALAFYAAEKTWVKEERCITEGRVTTCGFFRLIDLDGGKLAREALGKKEDDDAGGSN